MVMVNRVFGILRSRFRLRPCLKVKSNDLTEQLVEVTRTRVVIEMF